MTAPAGPDDLLEPFADRHEQAAAEDAMRATLPPGHPEALAQEDVELDPRVLSGELCGECATTGHSRCRGVCLVDAAVPADGGATPATDRDTARQQVARWLWERSVWQHENWEPTDEAWANYRHREVWLTAADELMVEVVDPLIATIARVEAELARLVDAVERGDHVLPPALASARRLLGGDR